MMKKLLFVLALSFFFVPFAQAQFAFSEVELESASSTSSLFIRVGRVAELAKIRLENNDRRNLVLEEITFRNYGNSDLDKALANFTVTVGGQYVPVETTANRNEIRVFFPEGLFIRGGDSPLLRIQATSAYARRGDTLQLGIRRNEDVLIRDVSSGFYVPVAFEEGIVFTEYELNPGSLYANNTRSARYYGSRANYTPSSSLNRRTTTSQFGTTSRNQFAPGARDVVFLNRSVSSNRPFDVEGLFFSVDTSQSRGNIEASFEEFQLFVNDRQEDRVGSIETFNGRLGLFFDRDFGFEAGSHNIKVVGRVSREAQSGDRLRLLYSQSSFLEVDFR